MSSSYCSSNSKRSDSDDDSPNIFVTETHSINVLKELFSMRWQNVLCDVVLKAGNHRVNAHRIVLSSCSQYFRAMFTTHFREKTEYEITINDVEAHILQILVDYVYSGKIRLLDSNVQALLSAANLFQITEVRNLCCNFLERHLHSSNCIGIRAIANLYECPELATEADLYISEHFSEVIEENEYVQFSESEVSQFIQRGKRLHNDEEKVFNCVMKWIKHDLENRKSCFPTLMKHIRLHTMKQEFLLQKVRDEKLLLENPECVKVVMEALLSNKTESMEWQSSSGSLVPKMLLVAGGLNRASGKYVQCYNFARRTWVNVADLPQRWCRAGIAAIGEKVYVMGGCYKSVRTDKMVMYDSRTDEWVSSVPMDTVRSTLGAVALNGRIYAVGGYDGGTSLNTSEVFDPEIQRWNPIAPMSKGRSMVGVGVLNELIYAVGGNNNAETLKCVEYYNPKTNIWRNAAEMTCRRSGACVGVLDGVLYVIGGRDGQNIWNSMEAYYPHTNTWRLMPSMHLNRRNAGVVSHEGKLYVVGGSDGSSDLSSVEIYCPQTKTWTLMSEEMSTGRTYPAVSLIEEPPKVLMVMCGDNTQSVECYEFKTRTWIPLNDMPSPRMRVATAVDNEVVYLLDGKKNLVHVYKTYINEWTTEIPMNSARMNLSAASLNGKIYVVGGSSGNTARSDVEEFDPEWPCWGYVAWMNNRRNHVGLGVLDNRLYAVGGYDGVDSLRTVERYDPETDEWHFVAPMPRCCSSAGVCALNGLLYVVGGRNGDRITNAASVYNPTEDSWREVASMISPRRFAGVVAYEGKLYVVGGDDGPSSLSTVEVYTPETNSWALLPVEMSAARRFPSVAVVNRPPRRRNVV